MSEHGYIGEPHEPSQQELENFYTEVYIGVGAATELPPEQPTRLQRVQRALEWLVFRKNYRA